MVLMEQTNSSQQYFMKIVRISVMVLCSFSVGMINQVRLKQELHIDI